MTRVSSKKVKQEVLLNISTLLVKQFARVQTSPGARTFMEEFFTPTEQVMFAKRFAIIVMLTQGYSYGKIQKTLGVSSSTVARIWKEADRGSYDKMLTQCFPSRGRGSRSGKQLVDVLEVLLRGGMPPMGRGRWRYLYKKTKHLQPRRDTFR